MKKLLLVLGLVTGFIVTPQTIPTQNPPKVTQHKHKHKKFKLSSINELHVTAASTVYLLYVALNSSNTKSYISVGQCYATAVSTGQRCKRAAASGSAYCWQH